MKADAAQSGTLGGGDEHPPAQAALIGRAPAHASELAGATRPSRDAT